MPHDAAGTVYETTDPMNREARTVFDYAGLATGTIAIADLVRTIIECRTQRGATP